MIEPILQSRCVECHTQDPNASLYPLGTWQQVYQLRAATLRQIEYCEMPPLDAGPLTQDERSALLQWLVCGAPEQ